MWLIFSSSAAHVLGRVYILLSGFSSNGHGFELIHLYRRVVPLGLTAVVLIWLAWLKLQSVVMEPNQSKQLLQN